MTDAPPTAWNDPAVRHWLESRVARSRLDQAAAQRAERGAEDDCDAAAAEEMVCTLLLSPSSATDQKAFVARLRTLLDRDDYSWRGVYDDARFDRHVCAYLRKVARMAKANEGFERTGRYQ